MIFMIFFAERQLNLLVKNQAFYIATLDQFLATYRPHLATGCFPELAAVEKGNHTYTYTRRTNSGKFGLESLRIKLSLAFVLDARDSAQSENSSKNSFRKSIEIIRTSDML